VNIHFSARKNFLIVIFDKLSTTAENLKKFMFLQKNLNILKEKFDVDFIETKTKFSWFIPVEVFS